MTHAVVNVATTDHYRRGTARLRMSRFTSDARFYLWMYEPPGCPPHLERAYAFKAYALNAAADDGADLLLWCDSCILPVRSLEPLWARIERDGYWFARNGFSNYEWTADSAYPDLFPGESLEDARAINRTIPHVVATAFGLNVRSEIGRAFLDEYFRLASETRAFCGPWTGGIGVQHRHDQTCASVIAWRLGMKLVDPPEIFSYPPGDERTILIADGAYE